MALLIYQNRLAKLTEPANKKFTLREMYALIGNGCDIVQRVKCAKMGTIRFIGVDGEPFLYELNRRMWIWMDEEGTFKEGMEVNTIASSISGIHTIVGNVLLTGTGEA